MKSNVKAALLLLVAIACHASGSGLVMAPMLETSTDVAATTPSDADAGSFGTRSLGEPHSPPNQSCDRSVECISALTLAPRYPFPAPYDRCDPSPIGRTGRFSARETDDRRRSAADAGTDVCCYVSFEECSAHESVRPIRHFHRP